MNAAVALARQTGSIVDRMIFIVVCSSKDGTYLPERNACDLDRATTVKDIADGQFDDVVQILECNPVEGTCRDVTEDIAYSVSHIWATRGEPLSRDEQEFIELHLGFRAVRAFEEA